MLLRTHSPRLPRPLATVLSFVVAILVATLVVGSTAWAQADDAAAATPQDNPVVLRYGDTVERLDAFNARFEIAIRTLAANQGVQITDAIRAQLEALKPQYLDQRATEIVLLDEARTRGLEVDPDEVDATVERFRTSAGSDDEFRSLIEQSGFADEAQLRRLVGETLLVDKVVEQLRSEIDIGDGELRSYYLANRAQFTAPATACARHILVDTVDEAEAVLADLDGGADFATLASERSTGPSAAQGGDLGCFERDRMVAPFADAAFAADIGVPVGPVETQFGQHVILVYDRTDGGLQPFDEVRDQVEQQVRQAQLQQRITALRRGAGVVTYPDRLAPAPAPTPDEGAAPADDAAPTQAPADGDSAN